VCSDGIFYNTDGYLGLSFHELQFWGEPHAAKAVRGEGLS
jgi:hypothetical protein